MMPEVISASNLSELTYTNSNLVYLRYSIALLFFNSKEELWEQEQHQESHDC